MEIKSRCGKEQKTAAGRQDLSKGNPIHKKHKVKVETVTEDSIMHHTPPGLLSLTGSSWSMQTPAFLLHTAQQWGTVHTCYPG